MGATVTLFMVIALALRLFYISKDYKEGKLGLEEASSCFLVWFLVFIVILLLIGGAATALKTVLAPLFAFFINIVGAALLVGVSFVATEFTIDFLDKKAGEIKASDDDEL